MDIDMDMVMTVLMSDQVLLRLVLASSSLAPKTLNWPSRRYYIDGDSTNVRSVVVDVDDFSSTLSANKPTNKMFLTPNKKPPARF